MSLESFLKSATGGFATGAIDTGIGLVRDALGRHHAKDMMREQQAFTEKMAKNKYSYEVESMLKAGLNPAMAHGNAQLATAPSTPSTPSSAQGSIKQARQLYKEEMELMEMQKADYQASVYKQEQEGRKESALADLYETDVKTRHRSNLARILLDEFSANLTAEQRNIVIAKHELIREFKNSGGVGTYLNNQKSQAGYWDAEAGYKREITGLAEYEAVSRRIDANAHATQAEVQKFLSGALKKVYEAQERNYEQVTKKEKEMTAYYAALMAKTQSEAELTKLKEEAYKKLGGSNYQACIILMDDIMRNMERGAKIANYITSSYANVVNSNANVVKSGAEAVDAVVPF